MKTLLLLWLALSGPLGFQQAVLVLSGASCAEELSEDEMARYQSLAAHPVDLNAAGRSRLLSTGLLTPYQVASLLDYRARSGAVLSWTELGLVDGFGAELAAALQEFCTLGAGHAAPGARPDRRVRQSLTLRASARGALRGSASALAASPASKGGGGLSPVPVVSTQGGGAVPFLQFSDPAAVGGVKYELAVGERAALYWSARTTYSEPQPTVGTVSAAWYGRRALGQLIVGNFGARFGQGLVQWSGFALSGYNSLGAFRRNGTGFSPTGSWSPALFGLASDWHFGPWRLSVAYSLGPTLTAVSKSNSLIGQPIFNLTRTWRRATAGLTATGEAASLEARVALPGWSLFGEFALRYPRSLQDLLTDSPAVYSGTNFWARWPVRAIAGAIWVPEYGHRAGIVARWLGLGKEYSGVAAGYEGPAFSATADASLRPDTRAFQLKSLLQWRPTLALSAPDSLTQSRRLSFVSATSSEDASATSPLTLQPLLRAQLRWRPADTIPLPAAISVLPLFVTTLTQPSTKAVSQPSVITTSPSIGAISLPSVAAAETGEGAFPFAAAGVRLDLRGMLTATAGPWILAGRYDAVLGQGFAWNWYLEAGWKTEPLAVYARGGIFKVDDWDDRIYVYERDAPGSFTVPARYGRGWDAALYAAWRPASRHTLWLRLEAVRYPAPWALTPKDGRLELRLQYRYHH